MIPEGASSVREPGVLDRAMRTSENSPSTHRVGQALAGGNGRLRERPAMVASAKPSRMSGKAYYRQNTGALRGAQEASWQVWKGFVQRGLQVELGVTNHRSRNTHQWLGG